MNESLLVPLYPPIACRVRDTIQKAKDIGLPPCDIFMGLRSWEQQDLLYSLGRTTKNKDGYSPKKPLGNTVTRARGGQSWHNYGLAADIVFRPNGQWSWSEKLPWEELGRIGESFGLMWGNKMGPDEMEKWDRPHFQMIGKLTLSIANDLYNKGGIPVVWNSF